MQFVRPKTWDKRPKSVMSSVEYHMEVLSQIRKNLLHPKN